MDGNPSAGPGLGRGRQWGESRQVLEDLVLEGSGWTKSQLLSKELCYNQSSTQIHTLPESLKLYNIHLLRILAPGPSN